MTDLNVRWTSARKAVLLGDIRLGVISADAACHMYGLSAEELAEWSKAYDARGEIGLKFDNRRQKRVKII